MSIVTSIGATSRRFDVRIFELPVDRLENSRFFSFSFLLIQMNFLLRLNTYD